MTPAVLKTRHSKFQGENPAPFRCDDLASRMSRSAQLSHFSGTGVSVRIFLTCWLVFTLHFATNTVREIFPVLSLGDHLSFDVSEYAGLHTDTFEIPGRGTFINNNPGASMMGAIPYMIFLPVTERITERVQTARAANPQSEASYDTIYPMAEEFYRKAVEKGFDIKFGLAAAVTQAFAMAPIWRSALL